MEKITGLKEFLDEKADLYNQPKFIKTDPIQIPHLFSKKEDIEISGFLTATIAWGNRLSIIKSANRLMSLMDNEPHEFILHASAIEKKQLEKFEDMRFI